LSVTSGLGDALAGRFSPAHNAPDKQSKKGEGMSKNIVLLTLVAVLTSGCCVITCNTRPPNSHIKVSSVIPADCTFADKAGVRRFKAPGMVLGMPKNAPGTLTCTATGHQAFVRTLTAQDWQPLTALSGDPNALRYYVEIELIMKPGS